jgi:ubiquinone/menaquinone biosynthesis C-methylase UbiE
MKLTTGMLGNIMRRYAYETDAVEFRRIKGIILRLYGKGGKIKIADIGSGLCNFSDYIFGEFSTAKIECLDINPDLVKHARSDGYAAKEGSILDIPYEDRYFDVVHCSHVLEHLVYPDITKAIEELFRITKSGGIVIIRSPLVANHRFYDDIDHVRPYPPAAVLNYFSNPQQSKSSKTRVKEICRWYTRIAYEINYHKYTGLLAKILNFIFKISWLAVRMPVAGPNNYGLVLRKES